MSKKTKSTEVAKVEVVVNPLLDVYRGFEVQESIDAIKSQSLKRAVVAFGKANVKISAGMWDRAEACYKMKKEETDAEFGTDERMADFLGLANKGSFNKLRHAGEYRKDAEAKGLPVTFVIEMLPLANKAHGSQSIIDHMDTVAETCLSSKEVREYVNSFKALPEKSAEESEQMSTSEPEETEEDVSRETFGTEEDIAYSFCSVVNLRQNVIDSMTDDAKEEFLKACEKFLIDYGFEDYDFLVEM